MRQVKRYIIYPMPSRKDRFEIYGSFVTPGEQEVLQINSLEISYCSCFPSENFGEVSVGAADVRGFVTPFEQALESGYQDKKIAKGDEFLVAAAQKGLDAVYVVKALEDSDLAKQNSKAWKNHQPDFLQACIEKLRDLEQKLDQKFATVTPLFLSAYQESIASQIEFCRNALNMGRSEYTVHQRSHRQWARLIDVGRTAQAGEIVLRLEDTARQALEMKPKTYLFETVEQAFSFWQLSESERREITGDEVLLAGSLTPLQGMRLFDVLRKRIGLTDWSVIKNAGSKAINVNSGSRTVDYPETRTLTPDEIVLLPPHELGVHAVSGENGSHQLCPLIRTGLSDYLATQEGLATIAEMIVGEPFGHPRQRLFAARYLATAMALKTVEQDGVRKPKHSLQEIYNTLRNYQVDAKDASQTIWRMMRGTSLMRKTVDLPLPNNAFISVAETFVKDTVYFEGFMKLRDFFLQTVPLRDSEIDEKGNASIHGKQPEDFSIRLLARIGRAIAMSQAGLPQETSFGEMRKVYEAYTSTGREALINILQFFLAGKLRFEDMADPKSPWLEVLRRYPAEGMVQFRRLFKPPAAEPLDRT